MSGSGDDKKIENTNLNVRRCMIMKNVMMFSLMVMLMVGVTVQADVVDAPFVNDGGNVQIAAEGASSTAGLVHSGMSQFGYGGVCTGYKGDGTSKFRFNGSNQRI